MSDRRWRRGESRRRLLDAALVAIAEAGPSGVSGRKVAKTAGVQHPQIQQMFGSVDQLLETALLTERDRFVADVFDTPDSLPDPFALVDFSVLWRAITQVVLDPGPIDLATLAAHGPVARFTSTLAPTRADPGLRGVIASAWFAMPLGYLVFEETFKRDLGLTPQDLHHSKQRIRHRLRALAEGASLPDLRNAQRSAAPTGEADAPTHGRERLLAAAEDLLATRVETSIRGRELATHAGVNHGLISHYFGSMSSLFDEALVALHSKLVQDVVTADGDLRLAGGPEVFTEHRAFIRAWASRLIGRRTTPDFELLGLRALIDSIEERRGSEADRQSAVGDALAVMSLGLGWALLAPLPTAGDPTTSEETTDGIYRIHYWLIDG